MSLTLVILAAGMGSRFGGNKPLAQIGPSGQSLFEYSVYDAVNAGYEHVVIVVSAEQDTTEFSDRLARYGDKLKIDFAVQSINTGISEKFKSQLSTRDKPWGTGHAVLVCEGLIDNPFVVINADDYYGRTNFKLIGEYLKKNEQSSNVCTLPGYVLENTLSHSGGVNRGVCSVDSEGYLTSICEVKNIHKKGRELRYSEPQDSTVTVTGDSIVSMTFWGFHHSIFKLLNSSFETFLNETADIENDEFYIPTPVNQAVTTGELRVKLIPTSEHWKGVTYAEDVKEVSDYMVGLSENGLYPL